MNLIARLKSFVLPKEIDFFENLHKQSVLTEQVVEELYNVYLTKSAKEKVIKNLSEEAKKLRKKNLIELNSVFITPVDKEAISRLFNNLYWIVLSIKHLEAEIDTYGIKELNEYKDIFSLLKKQIRSTSTCFTLIQEKKYNEVMSTSNEIIHFDNEIIKLYASYLAKLFEGNDMQRILQYREILSQLKEISKRIHVCSNYIEDLVFKMN